MTKQGGDSWKQAAQGEKKLAEYWESQAAAERERADKLQVELREYTEAHWKAFEREKKLREAIEQTITDMGGEYYTKNPIVNRLMNVLYLLYPDKEGEAK